MDLPLLRVRRSIEWAGLISRSVSVLWIVGSLVLWSLPVTTALWAVPLALTNLLAWYALRNAGRPRYPALNALVIAAGTATVVGAVLATSGTSSVALWPIFVIAIVVGAFRGRLAGALLTWLATTAGTATATGSGDTLDALLRAADAGMYREKADHRRPAVRAA